MKMDFQKRSALKLSSLALAIATATMGSVSASAAECLLQDGQNPPTAGGATSNGAESLACGNSANAAQLAQQRSEPTQLLTANKPRLLVLRQVQLVLPLQLSAGNQSHQVVEAPQQLVSKHKPLPNALKHLVT